MSWRLWLLILTVTAVPMIAEEPVAIIDSGPWDNSYSALDAPRTKTWIRFHSPAMTELAEGEKLRFWLQWTPSLTGPWKVHSKGEMELRQAVGSAKGEPSESQDVRTRGYFTKKADRDDEGSLEMNPLPTSRWIEYALPYFRVAQAIRQPGKAWVRTARKMLAPEDNNALYSEPFEGKLDIVYVYLPEAKNKPLHPISFTNTEIHPRQPGPWSSPSFKGSVEPYVSFFIALGGTNFGTVIPSHPFYTVGAMGTLEFWSCRSKPNGYRGTPVDDSSIDSLWWGVAPVRVPIPPPGESTTLKVTSPLFGQEYEKTFTIFGVEATPKILAERRISTVRLHNLLERVDANATLPTESLESVAKEKGTVLASYRKQRTLYQERGEEEANALADAYIQLLNVLQKEYFLKRQQSTASEVERKGEALRDLLAAAGIAGDLQDWNGMKQQLDAYSTLLETLEQKERPHFLFSEFGLRNLEPFDKGFTRNSFIEMMKEWAWITCDPDAYAHALDYKLSLKDNPTQPRSADDYVTPQEYRELAELIMERSGDRDKAESYWRRADNLILNPDSPFYLPKADEGKLHMQRPGWWPE